MIRESTTKLIEEIRHEWLPIFSISKSRILLADKCGKDITPPIPFEGLDKFINTGYSNDTGA